MKDITLKPDSLRTATATATIHMPADCVERLQARTVDKGDALEIARMAGIMAAKRTQDLLPFCHQVPLRSAEVSYAFETTAVNIETHVECIGPTGVEMEALTAASIAALTIYDMLKPHCTQTDMSITDTRLLKKRGGKSQFRRKLKMPATASVLTLSDTVAAGKKPDTAGASVRDQLAAAGFTISDYTVAPDEPADIKAWLQGQLDAGVDVVITVGGTGISPRDCTVETVQPFIDRALPGVMDAARQFGQDRTPFSMLSRGVAGMASGEKGDTFVATFPGSRKGAEETMAALLPGLVHLVEVCRHTKAHEGGYQ